MMSVAMMKEMNCEMRTVKVKEIDWYEPAEVNRVG